VTPLYPQKLELTSPTGGGRSVGIVRSRTKATEFGLVYASFHNFSLFTACFDALLIIFVFSTHAVELDV